MKNTIELSKLSPLQIIIVFFVLQLVVTLLSNGFVLSFDESVWHYIGRNWFRNGLVPYSGGADNKSPFIFVIYGLSDQLFGVNYWFVRITGTLCQSIGIYYVYKITKTLSSHEIGLVAISFYGLSLLWHSTGGVYVAFTETFEVMFLVIALYQFLTACLIKELIISGLVGGIAIDFRLTAAFGILSMFVVLIRRKQLNECFYLLLGTLSGLFILLGFCLLAGIDLSQLGTNALTDNFGKGGVTSHSLKYETENLLDKFIFSPMFLFYPLTLVYVLVMKQLDIFVLWCISTFVAISIIGLFDVVHLKDILPSLSIMNAIAVAKLIERYKHRVSFNFILVSVWVIFFPMLKEPFYNLQLLLGHDDKKIAYNVKPYVNPSESDRKLLGEWVKKNTKSTDFVFVHGYGTQIQAYSERISPTIYFFSVIQTPQAKARLRNDLALNKPEMILIPMFPQYVSLVSSDTRKFVNEMLIRDYYLERSLYNYKIYRRVHHYKHH
ncbi:ArnT family glycosyltransferase [Mucilaginibacter jinjuensis]|uniref:Glycosyltransferase family 39 protein n=1 Tax=Mucilaginibacter jinjuensis TaxID=1176721 RepID=A0ABY7TAD0_9SPHI|nr:glycosyltransferase family 39 protein [Mucilaginibacter jinjuensis]WCT13263.1 glycosyltransferase family 39 protein [Mucilaginibacter jinjuensis]